MPDHLESTCTRGHYSLEGAIFPGPQTSFTGDIIHSDNGTVPVQTVE